MANLTLRNGWRIFNSIWEHPSKRSTLESLGHRFDARVALGSANETLRKHRAIRNGRYLTRAHLARRPRAFHPVRVGDNVDVRNLADGYWFRQTGIVESVLPDWFDSRFVKIHSSWWRFAQTDYSEYSYVH